jgi:hypothetical protein
MSCGEWVESAIVWTVRVAMALLMLPLIPVYAALAAPIYPIALAVAPARPGAPDPAWAASPPDARSPGRSPPYPRRPPPSADAATGGRRGAATPVVSRLIPFAYAPD